MIDTSNPWLWPHIAALRAPGVPEKDLILAYGVVASTAQHWARREIAIGNKWAMRRFTAGIVRKRLREAGLIVEAA